jgi:hypothetical protein
MDYKGLYRGIVIQNNDPQQSGRVKVYVPGINLNQTKNWNQNKEEDKFFKVMGSNTGSSLNPQILDSQKERLLWAEVMLPLIGMSSPGFYNAPSDSYYIGNDSGYISQDSNKSAAAFAKDKQQSASRPSKSPLPNYGQPPRTKINLEFPINGLQFCLPNKCDKNGPVPNTVETTDPSVDSVVDQLPALFVEQPLNLDPPLPVNNNAVLPVNNNAVLPVNNNAVLPLDNKSVVGIDINVSNPTIFLNNVPLSEDNPIFNRECFISVNTKDMITFEPPILFEDADEAPLYAYNDIPVSLVINDKKSLPNNFKVSSYNNKEVIFEDGPIKIIANRNNINAINVRHNKNPFDLNKVLALKGFLDQPIPVNTGKTVMPRSPITNGTPMVSRGGGGGEIFNNISSKLLPTFQRKDMHVGGANNESRATVNRCRKPSNDINNTKGANVVGSVSQMHRGPMRAPDYNNDFKGMISIPGVGSHVWIYFENGDLNYPIILGSFASKADYKGIFESA